ncbi:MAG: rhomboid family intramembrane serine protease [Candidatus Eremiobacteraeota bacterium]|nr:rhomboid family intramembrane serine protease [Candidatus Eremiobacteraeota bacterium]
MIPIGDRDRSPVFPIVVYAIVVLNVYVFVREAQTPAPDAFVNAFAVIPYDVTHGIVLAPPGPPLPWFTLITSQFLHGSILHIFFNMLFLLVFGPEIEYLCGHFRFAVFYLLGGTIAGLTQVLVYPGSHVPSIGASGAIAAVLGGYIVTFPTNTIQTIVPIGCFPLFLRLPAILVIGVWAAVQFVTGFGAISTRVASEQGGGIAYFAHIGGFLAGVLLIGFFRTRPPGSVGRRYRYYYR